MTTDDRDPDQFQRQEAYEHNLEVALKIPGTDLDAADKLARSQTDFLRVGSEPGNTLVGTITTNMATEGEPEVLVQESIETKMDISGSIPIEPEIGDFDMKEDEE